MNRSASKVVSSATNSTNLGAVSKSLGLTHNELQAFNMNEIDDEIESLYVNNTVCDLMKYAFTFMISLKLTI